MEMKARQFLAMLGSFGSSDFYATDRRCAIPPATPCEDNLSTGGSMVQVARHAT